MGGDKNDKHTYAQAWHFDILGEHFEAKVGGKEYSWAADGFLREEIITGGNRLFTCQKGEANIFIYHLGDVEYERHFAAMEPFVGWGACYYENDTKFRYYPVEEIHCKFNGKANTVLVTILEPMLMYGKEASNRKQEIDRQHHTIPSQRNQRLKDKRKYYIVVYAYSIRH